MIVRLAALLLALLFAVPGQAAPRVLLFHRATGFVHGSIPTAVVALTQMARTRGLEPVASDDPAVFDAPLDYAAIVLVSTTTDPKRPESEWFVGPRQGALQRYVEGGGGIVAIHAAADSHYNWPWYARMIGGRFAQHPLETPIDRSAPLTTMPTPASHRRSTAESRGILVPLCAMQKRSDAALAADTA